MQRASKLGHSTQEGPFCCTSNRLHAALASPISSSYCVVRAKTIWWKTFCIAYWCKANFEMFLCMTFFQLRIQCTRNACMPTPRHTNVECTIGIQKQCDGKIYSGIQFISALLPPWPGDTTLTLATQTKLNGFCQAFSCM